MNIQKPSVGLFGTCGNSTWRQPFIEEYEKRGIRFFNPQVDDWRPELAAEEAHHLVNDEIILFPVTWETDGLGSLAESGFSIMQALKNPSGRDFVIAISDMVDESLVTDPAVARASVRARALVKAHLLKLDLPNVYIVRTLTDMLDLSLDLHDLRVRQLGIDADRRLLARYRRP